MNPQFNDVESYKDIPKIITMQQEDQVPTDDFTCKNHVIVAFEKHLAQFEDKLSNKFKKVLILNTGGTISMVSTERGLVTQQGSLQECMKKNPYLCDNDYTYFQAPENFLITPETMYHRRILYQIQELDTLIDSANMDPIQWFEIGNYIKKEYEKFDAFVILHGTDTMAYTASALSFMFENLQKTIVITGSQVPLSFARNDGFQNILNALTIAGHFQIPEVLIAFYDKLLRGNRSQKVSSMKLASFDSPKFTPLGKFAVHVDIIWELINKIDLAQEEPLRLTEKMCLDVTSIRLTPLVNAETFKEIFKNKNIKGMVIETYGAGNWKSDVEILSVVKQASERGVIIISISQCFNSRVVMLYETGIIYEEVGVISGADLTIEAAMSKLSYLLGKNLSNEEIKLEMQKNLRGELTPETYEAQFNIENEPFLQELSNAISDSTEKGINNDLIMPNIVCLMCKQNMKTPLLKKTNINVQSLDYDNRSVLHIAAREGSLEIAEWIIECGVSQVINERDRFQHSPLFEAVKGRKKEMINLLVRHQAELIAPLKELTSMLMKAVNEDDMELLEMFYLANIRDFSQFRTIDNRTIAHLAASINNASVVIFLRKAGVFIFFKNKIKFDWSLKDRAGKTPIDEAKLQGRGQLNLFLKTYTGL